MPFFFKRASGAVTGEPFAFWVIRQPAKHIHRNAILQKTFHNIIDAEIFRPEMLRNNKNLFLRGQRAHTFRKLGVRKQELGVEERLLDLRSFAIYKMLCRERS